MKDKIIIALAMTILILSVISILEAEKNSGSMQKLASIRSVAQYNQDYKDYEWKTIVDIVDGGTTNADN
jgi:hypothetical protein